MAALSVSVPKPNRMKQIVGDWIVYHEPRRSSGRSGYNAIARLQEVIADPTVDGMFVALIEPGSYQPLEQFVPYHSSENGYLESSLNDRDGNLNRGLMQWSVRPLSQRDFCLIVELSTRFVTPRCRGVSPSRSTALLKLSNRSSSKTSAPARRRWFESFVAVADCRRQVLEAYHSRCAVTGLKLINGGGRAEVEAAHIRPSRTRSDHVRNGIALSGTVH